MNQYERWDAQQIQSTMNRLRDENAKLSRPKHLRRAFLIAIAFAGGWWASDIAQPPIIPSTLEAELLANEAACADEKYASYPVTKWGSLRGCLLVRTSAVGMTHVFVKKEIK